MRTARASREALGVEDAWPVMTEPFRQWVIEDDFPAGRPDWEKFGVEMVRDVRPFEEMKLRLLNGAHSSIAYLGLLAGHDTVAKSFGDPAIRGFVAGVVGRGRADASQRRRPRPEKLCRRTHGALRQHGARSIAPRRSPMTAARSCRSASSARRSIGLRRAPGANHLMLTVAAWIRAAELRGTKLPAGHFTDPLDAPLARIAEAGQPASGHGRAPSSSLPVSREAKPHRATLEKLASAHLDTLRKDGVAAALAALQPTGKSAVKQTWRWFGPNDPVLLSHVRQAGATGVVTALHHLNDGRAWPADEIAKRKAEIEAAGLTWSVVESVIVHEDIKTRSGRYRELIDNYKASIRALSKAGIKTICYNFMAITDWTRTDLDYPMWHGGTALRFDIVDFCAYDVLVLKRAGAEAEHPAERIEAAKVRLAAMSESDLAKLETNLIGWVPAREFIHDRESFRRALDLYRDVSVEGFRENLFAFLREIVPVAEEEGVRMAIHPDDPPFPIFGLPRVVSSADDAAALLAAVPSPSNGLTLCTGSYGAGRQNDLPAMAKRFASDIHFAHLRNVTKEPDGSFHEAEHLEGDTDMVAVVDALLAEERRRKAEGRADWEIPMRPDHGHVIVDDIGKKVNPGYSCIGRLKGLAELRGIMRTLETLRA